MEPDTLAQQQNIDEPPEEAAEGPAAIEGWVNPHDAARSEENILQWMSYLPEDCVRTMIEMGWDKTT
jgi:hypothetical protein